MSDKDKEAFEKWELDVEWSTAFISHRLAAVDAWQAACEYARNEFKFQTSPAVVTYMEINDKLVEENKKLQKNILLLQEKTLVLGELESENKKLRDALNILRQNLKWDHGNSEIIIEALKEDKE